jgi:hypothetical protein
MSSETPTPCDRLIARRRRIRAIAWCLFLLFIVLVFAFRILRR